MRTAKQLKPQEQATLLQSAPRCAIFNSEAAKLDPPHPKNWWVSYSPAQCLHAAEGSWEDWVRLARLIIATDRERQIAEVANDQREG
jgi:hypothetical protein